MATPNPSGWTIESLKELQDERELHRRDLREADQRALDLLQKQNAEHFHQLNAAAERTKEERIHFISSDTFIPFQRQVLEFMASNVSRGGSYNQMWGIIIQVLTLAGFLIAILLKK